jgi:hypothetical protein
MIEGNHFFRAQRNNMTFADVCKAMNHSNIPSGLKPELEEFLKKNPQLKEGEYVPIATHSFGGRDWALVAGSNPAFFPEVGGGGEDGWYFFTERDITYILCESYTSSSRLIAQKRRDGDWDLILEVPVKDGTPYMGSYWASYAQAIGEELPPQEESPEITTVRRRARVRSKPTE